MPPSASWASLTLSCNTGSMLGHASDCQAPLTPCVWSRRLSVPPARAQGQGFSEIFVDFHCFSLGSMNFIEFQRFPLILRIFTRYGGPAGGSDGLQGVAWAPDDQSHVLTCPQCLRMMLGPPWRPVECMRWSQFHTPVIWHIFHMISRNHYYHLKT